MMYDWLSVTVKVRGLAQRVLLLSTAAHSDPLLPMLKWGLLHAYSSGVVQTWVGQSVATVKRSKFSSPQFATPPMRRRCRRWPCRPVYYSDADAVAVVFKVRCQSSKRLARGRDRKLAP